MALFPLLGCRHSPKVVPAEVTDTEYQVLSAYFTGKFKRVPEVRQIVIFSETLPMADDLKGINDLGYEHRMSAIAAAHGPLFRVLLDANRNSTHFHRSFSLPVPYQIIESSEMRSIFGTKGDIWGRFYQKYPNSSGFLALSRVGFSPNENQAAFYMSNHCGGLCGAGYFVIMEKRTGSDWKVLQETHLWIS